MFVSPVPLWMILATLALSLAGFVGNLLIVTASIVSKQLRGRCQLFIAALAAVDMVVCFYLVGRYKLIFELLKVLLRILMLFGWFFVTNRNCFLVSSFGIFSLNAQSAIGLILGIDRLLAVVIPTRFVAKKLALLGWCKNNDRFHSFFDMVVFVLFLNEYDHFIYVLRANCLLY